MRHGTVFWERSHVSLIATAIVKVPPQAVGSVAWSLALATLGRWPCLLHCNLAHATINLFYSAREFQTLTTGGGDKSQYLFHASRGLKIFHKPFLGFLCLRACGFLVGRPFLPPVWVPEIYRPGPFGLHCLCPCRRGEPFLSFLGDSVGFWLKLLVAPDSTSGILFHFLSPLAWSSALRPPPHCSLLCSSVLQIRTFLIASLQAFCTPQLSTKPFWPFRLSPHDINQLACLS